MRFQKIIQIVSLFWLTTFNIQAQANDNAKQLVIQCKQNIALKNAKASVNLTVTDKKGRLTEKSMTITFGNFKDIRKMLIELTAPEKINGMRISVSDSMETKSEIQIYLPATGNVQKMNITSKEFNLPGSNFSLDYLRSTIKTGTTFSFAENTTIDGVECLTVLVQHKDHSEHEILYISRNKNQLLKVNTLNKNNEVVTEALFSDYKVVKGTSSTLFPGKISIRSLLTQKSSVLTVNDIESITTPDKAIFDLSSLAAIKQD